MTKKKQSFDVSPARACKYLGKNIYKVVQQETTLRELKCKGCGEIKRYYEYHYEVVRAQLDAISIYARNFGEPKHLDMTEFIRDDDPTYGHRSGPMFLTLKEAKRGLARMKKEELERRKQENHPDSKSVEEFTDVGILRKRAKRKKS